MNRSKNVYKNIMIVLITAMITMLLSIVAVYNYIKGNGSTKYVYVGTDEKPQASIDESLKVIKDIMKQYYLSELPSDQELLEGAIKGYVAALEDEYSEYMTSEEWKNYQESTMGNYVGLGVLLRKQEDGLNVVSIFADSPAEKADLQEGDLIVKVDDIVCSVETADEAISYMKNGAAGSKFTLQVIRNDETLTKEITREVIRIMQATGKMLENNIGYIQLLTFDEGATNDLREKTKKLISEGAKGIILDLRNNGGGLLDQATEIADMFLEKDKVIMITNNKDKKEEMVKTKKAAEFNIPLVVLCNGRSASASEILIGALKDNFRAMVVGTKTYGKGVVQKVMTLSNGSLLKLTTEEFIRPNGEKINKIGIEPNINAADPEGYNGITNIPVKDDTQLQRALQIIQTEQ